MRIEPRISGDFSSFLCTSGGYGIVGMRGGKPFADVVAGKIEIERFQVVMPD
jgi:hypothetical protein